MVYAGNAGRSGFREGGEETVNNRKKGFQGVTTQIGKKIPVIEEVPAQDFRDAEDDVTVFTCNFFQSPPSKS